MARGKRRFPNLTREDAHAALRWLVATGVVSAKQIADALKKRQELVEEIRSHLEAFGAGGGRFLLPGEPPTRPATRRRRKPSAKARAAWQQQGRYMGFMRGLSKADRTKVRAVREKSGVRAAIATAKRLAK